MVKAAVFLASRLLSSLSLVLFAFICMQKYQKKTISTKHLCKKNINKIILGKKRTNQLVISIRQKTHGNIDYNESKDINNARFRECF